LSFSEHEKIHAEGRELENRGLWEDSLAYHNEALQKADDDEEKAYLTFHAALCNSRIGRFRESREAFGRSLFPGLDPLDRSSIINELAFVYYRRNLIDRAFMWLRKVHHIPPSRAWAQNLHYRGLCLFRKNRRVEAMECLKRALALYQDLKLIREKAQVLDSLGMFFSEMGEMDESIAHYHESLAIKEEAGDEYGIAITCGNLGRSHLERMELDLALASFDRDVLLCEKIKDSYGIMVMHNNRGRAFTLKRDFGQASQLLKKSQDMAHSSGNALWQAICLKDMAYNHLCQGFFDRAYDEVEESLLEFRKLGAPTLTAEALRVKAIVLRAQKDYAMSEAHFLESLALYNDLEIPFASAETLFQLGLLYHRRREISKALTYLDEAIDIAEKLRAPWLLSRFEGFLKEIDQEGWLRLCLRRYLGAPVLDSLLSTERAARDQSGTRVQATVLFVGLDLGLGPGKDFAGYAAPEEIVSLLNEYLGSFADICDDNGGVVEGFIGEEMMIYFKDSPGISRKGTRCAAEIMKKASRLGDTRVKMKAHAPRIAAGLTTGPVFAGAVGAYRRLQYKITGSTVNLASRLLHRASEGQVLLDGQTGEEVAGEFPLCPLPSLEVKGFSERQKVWELLWSA
jgi:class 3 adenylate cyclase